MSAPAVKSGVPPGSIEVDPQLVRAYNIPGPRYTSYPTVPNFTEAFSGEEWAAHLLANGHSGNPLSLYVHIPFCNKLCWFCGCTMVVERREAPIDRYVDSLKREIDLYASLIDLDRPVVQIHFGGGTPTHLSPGQIRSIGRHLHNTFYVSPAAEISFEIDPRGLTPEHVTALSEVGLNRASVGIQDFDERVQHAVNRVHDLELVGRVVDWLRAADIESLNLDLIYGLPHQTVATFSETLKEVLGLAPDRLAVFSYAHVPWIKPHQKLIRAEDMPVPEEKIGMLKLVAEELTSSGFQFIGMDHFALETDDLARAQRAGTLQRNFQGYSTHRGVDIYAFGMSSISQLPMAYGQHTKVFDDYYAAIDGGRLPVFRGRSLTTEDHDRRHVIMRLMCDMGLDYEAISNDLGVDFSDRYGAEIDSMDGLEADGLVIRSASGLQVTSQGRLFVRNIAKSFDAYLDASPARYSQTV